MAPKAERKKPAKAKSITVEAIAYLITLGLTVMYLYLAYIHPKERLIPNLFMNVPGQPQEHFVSILGTVYDINLDRFGRRPARLTHLFQKGAPFFYMSGAESAVGIARMDVFKGPFGRPDEWDPEGELLLEEGKEGLVRALLWRQWFRAHFKRIGVLTRGPFYSPEGKKTPILDHIETLLDNGGWGAVRRLAMGQSEKCGVKKASGKVVGVVCLGTSFPRFVPMEYDKPQGKRICRCTDFPEYVVNPDHWFEGCDPSSKTCAANLTKEEL